MDEELIVRLAEKVMGWQFREDEPIGPNQFWSSPDWPVILFTPEYKWWNPLTNEADNAMVLEKMAEKFSVYLSRSGANEREKWEFEIWKPDLTVLERQSQEWDADRKRAICLAALKAVDHD